MSVIHRQQFRVRYYECDAYGHVNNANYLRYMQEAAFGASAALGYDMARYAEMGTVWLIRDTDIEFISPLRYGDTVEVETWVVDFQHVRSRRMYRFTNVATGDPVARAITEWAYLDVETLRPVPIGEEIKAAFLPDGASPEDAPPRTRFPAPPPPPPGAFTVRRRVEWRDIDPMQHVNNAVYLSYIEDCGVQVTAAFNWPVERMFAEGLASVFRNYRVEYRAPAFLGDELVITTWLSSMKRATGVRHFEIRRESDNTLLARARARWVLVDLETGRPVRIPEEAIADFGPNIAGARQGGTTS